MRRVVKILLLVVLCTAARAEAVSSKDILDLARAGLGEAVLLALVEVDGGVFTIDNAMLIELKAAGVSDRVIEAMVRSGRERPVPLPAPEPVRVAPAPPAPQIVIIEHDRPVVQTVAVPVYVPVVPRGVQRSRSVHRQFDPAPGFNNSLPGFVPVQPEFPEPRKKPEPVYWGWGGKLRPDAWKPAGEKK